MSAASVPGSSRPHAALAAVGCTATSARASAKPAARALTDFSRSCRASARAMAGTSPRRRAAGAPSAPPLSRLAARRACTRVRAARGRRAMLGAGAPTWGRPLLGQG